MTPAELLHELVSLLEIAIANEEAGDKWKRRIGKVALTLTPEWVNRANELISAGKQSTGDFEMSISRDRTFGHFLDLRGEQLEASEYAASMPGGGFLKRFRAQRQAREAASDAAWQRYQEDREVGAFDGTFLEWLFEHADEIFALIAKLIALFSA